MRQAARAFMRAYNPLINGRPPRNQASLILAKASLRQTDSQGPRRCNSAKQQTHDTMQEIFVAGAGSPPRRHLNCQVLIYSVY